MELTLIGPLLFLAIGAAVAIAFRKKMGGLGGGPPDPAALDRLYQSFGYHIVEKVSLQQARQAGHARAGHHMVRSWHDPSLGPVEIHWRAWADYSSGVATEQSWALRLARPAPVGLHVADARLASTAARVAGEIAHRRQENWRPAYSQPFASGNPQLDQRFRFFAEDPARAAQLVAAPALGPTLLAFPFVDVVVQADAVIFRDPFHKTLEAYVGKTAILNPSSPAATSGQRRLHDEVANLLLTFARSL